MIKQAHNPDNLYTQQMKTLVAKVYPKELGHGSVVEDARHYFAMDSDASQHIEELTAQIKRLQGQDPDAQIPDDLQQKLKRARLRQQEERLHRVERLHAVAIDILDLCEGETYAETQLASARFLGTIMLLTRGRVNNFAHLHQRLKPLYKAVLTLRLVDKLLYDGTVSYPYLDPFRESLSRFKGNNYWRKRWREELALPLISAALLQDIGLQHPDAQRILHGDDKELDEFRVLEETERKTLLRLNYTQTMAYLKQGLGLPAYRGNDKAERDTFLATHQAINRFREQLVQDAFVSKTGIGELLKIPQIYCSVLLSTKPDYSRHELPKGYLLIEQLGKKGNINAKLADAFIKIVGYFPQGFGITYIPKNERGLEKQHYEYAIVAQLNPKDPAEPVCRVASRNLTYICAGALETVSKGQNLYFPSNRKKLLRIGRDRLLQIMQQLSKDVQPDAVDDLVPPLWEPSDYFSVKKNQNIWNKS